MANVVRDVLTLKASESVYTLQMMRADLLKLHAGKILHADAVPAAANATPAASSLPTSVTLANSLYVTYVAHVASSCNQTYKGATSGQGAHVAADATNALSSGLTYPCVVLADVEAMANAIKTGWNAHCASTGATGSGSHPIADTVNTVSAATAVDQGTSDTLLNALQTAINAHVASAFVHQALQVVAP